MMKTLAPVLASLLAGCATDAAPAADPSSMSDDPTPDAPAPVVPRSGELDLTYGDGGVLRLGATLGDGWYAGAIAAQGDKLLVCATSINGSATSAVLMRITQDGALDTTFGTAGVFKPVPADTHSACASVAVLGDEIVVGYKGSTSQAMRLDRDAKTPGLTINGALPIVRAGTGTASGLFGTVQIFGGTSQTSWAWMDHLVASADVSPLAGKPHSTLLHNSEQWMIGVFAPTANDPQRWAVYTRSGDKMLSYGGTAGLGEATADLMLDAVRLPDGSLFAVGAVDNGTAVMAARFTATQPMVESHAHGGPSMGRAIVLDSADRPVVVGTATLNGNTAFGWQRYLPSSATLDESYGAGGLAAVAAPSGQGELVGATRIGDRIFALGHYDVQDVTPKLALVKIVE